MTNGFEIKVPITLKGGKEGEKVGKQIGEKIAAQLKKTFSALKIGGTSTAGPSGMLGVSKGLKGVATKLGIVGVAIAATLGLLKKSSPYLKGILDIFGRAFLMFFRPFGDFLATLLRPMAILMMKMAVAFIKWLRPGGVIKEGAEKAPQLEAGALGTGKLGISLTNFVNKLLRIGGSIGQILFDIGKAFFDFGGKIGQWLYDAILVPFFEFGQKVGQWIYDNVILPVGDWISEKLLGAWEWTKDLGTKIWEILKSPFVDLVDSIQGVIDKIKSFFGGGEREPIITRPKGLIENIIDLIKGEGQVGISNVPSDGMYQLHKGEQVIPKTKTSGSTILSPTFQFTGNVSQDIDVDAIARRASRMIEMELKQRGII